MARYTPPVAYVLAITFLVGLLVPVALPANEQFAGRVIADITIEGLRKTREDVVVDLMGIEPGDVVTEGLIDEVESALVDSELFAEVTVAPRPAENNGVDIRVEIDEKWTLIPIPFLATDGSSFRGGLILLESNLLGRNKQLISAAFLGTTGGSGFFAYVDPAVFGSSWTGRLSGATGRNEDLRVLPDGTTRVRSYEVEEQSAGLGVGYAFTRRLEAGVGFDVRTYNVLSQSRGPAGADIPRLDERGAWIEPSARITWDGTSVVDVLRTGLEARLEGRWVSAESGWEARSRLGWSTLLFGGHRLRLLASGALGDVPALAEQVISGRDGYRTLPYQEVSADSWGSGAVLYDLPVVRGDWGAFVLSHYWEAGAYTNETVDPRLFFGPGGGFRVYIRQVAIPALGLDVAYNIPDDGFVFSFSLGAQM